MTERDPVDIQKYLHTLELFKGLSETLMDNMSRKGQVKKYKRGDVIVSESEPVQNLFVVLDGQVKLSKSSADGKEQTLSILESGEPFGLCTAFASHSFPATVLALKRSTILSIPGHALQDIIIQEPQLLLNITRVLSCRLKETMGLVEALSLKDLPQRISSFLLHDLTRQALNSGSNIKLAITHRELSKIIGVTPEALSRTLRKMSEDGLLQVEGRSISVHDLEALEELAEG